MDTIAMQGDLRIIKIEKLPEKAIKKADNILLKGEVTGHAHRLVDGEVYNLGERILFQTYIPTYIEHDEHDPIPIEKGNYEIIRQREYKSKDMTVLVVD